MKKNLAIAILLTTLISSKALAQNNGVYIGLSGDLAFKKNTKFTDDGVKGKIDHKLNSGANIALGYNLGGGARIEAEGGYHAFGMKKITENGLVTNDKPKADIKVMTAMGNLYYDFNNFTGFSPYIGAGAGIASVNMPTKFFNTSKNKDTSFAYQFMTGISYTAKSMPAVNWFLGYRYLNVGAPQFAIKQDAGGGNLKLDRIGASNFEVGMRYNF